MNFRPSVSFPPPSQGFYRPTLHHVRAQLLRRPRYNIVPVRPEVQPAEVPNELPHRLEPPPESRCICLRDVSIIFCHFCGYHTKGRKKMTCPVHTNIIYLMDIAQCPKCRSYDLTEHPI